MYDEPKPTNMFAIAWPDLFGKVEKSKENYLYDCPRVDRAEMGPHINAHLKSLSLKGQELKDCKNKIERDWKAYRVFRRLLKSIIIEFQEKNNGPLEIGLDFPYEEIKAFEKRWSEVSMTLDKPFKRLHPAFIGFILCTQPR
jgi:hypothetical protein